MTCWWCWQQWEEPAPEKCPICGRALLSWLDAVKAYREHRNKVRMVAAETVQGELF